MPRPTRRRWARFSLRTLFVLMTLACVYLGWAMNWIRQRHEFLNRADVELVSSAYYQVQAPIALWLLGEKGANGIYFNGTDEEIDSAKRLFPEAKLNPFICVLELD